MNPFRALHVSAGFLLTLGISHLAQAVEIEPLHVDFSLQGRSWGEGNCEGGEWSLSWQGDLPGETRNVGDLLISYGAFDTTLEDDRADPKPRFGYNTLVCKDAQGKVTLRATMSGPGKGQVRGVLAIRNDPGHQSPFFNFEVDDVGSCHQVSELMTMDRSKVFIAVKTQLIATVSPALSFTRKELEDGFTKTYRLGGQAIATDGNLCLGTLIKSGQLTISYKQDIRRPKVELAGCANLARGASTEVQANPTPEGGTLTIDSDPAATMGVRLHGKSATVTGATPGRATLTARYVLNGQTATATLPASSVELVAVNGGAPIPKLGLYDENGMISSKVYQFPVATTPADSGDLLSFSPANGAIVSVVNGRSNVGVQPVRTGGTTLQARTACGAAIGPPVEIVIAVCDDDVKAQIQRKRDDLVRREKEIVKRITQLVADPEFQRAATEIKKSTTDFAIKSGELIIGTLTAKEVLSARGGDPTTVLNAEQLERAGAIWDGYNVLSDGASGEWDKAFVGAAVMKLNKWQVSLLKTAYETREATLQFSKDLGLIAGVARELEELEPKHDEIRNELYRMDVKLNRCEELPPPPAPPPTKRPPVPPKPVPQPVPQPTEQPPVPPPVPVPVPAPEQPTPTPPPPIVDPPLSGSAGLCVRRVDEYAQQLQQSAQAFEGLGAVIKETTAMNQLPEPQRSAGFHALAPRYDSAVQQFYKFSEVARAQNEHFTLCTNALPEWLKDLKTRY